MENLSAHKVAMALMVIGGLNWLLVGLSEKDLLVGYLKLDFDLARVVYVLVGLATLYVLWAKMGGKKSAE
ncbi:DUF378 domain-containing protein [Candidatus Saccharibacteria bacterium]|jgi:uncharacterized membrane protein YuzA (DUF378 family)|nr:MAG: DUF378 domain-containing protein [Candidatus Saccharibacteria bacterium]